MRFLREEAPSAEYLLLVLASQSLRRCCTDFQFCASPVIEWAFSLWRVQPCLRFWAAWSVIDAEAERLNPAGEMMTGRSRCGSIDVTCIEMALEAFDDLYRKAAGGHSWLGRDGAGQLAGRVC